MCFALLGVVLLSITPLLARQDTDSLPIKEVTVFCSSSHKIKDSYKKAAQELGSELSKNNLTLVFGGADTGLMGILAKAAKKGGSKIVNVFPEQLKSYGIEHATRHFLFFLI